MKKLVLLTNRFPFPPGEEFLSTELEVISNYINKIIVVPSTPPGNLKDKKNLPQNVDLLTEHLFTSSKTKMVLCLLRDTQGLKWFLKEFKFAFKHGFKGVLMMLNWLVIATHLKTTLLETLHKEGNDSIFYSYWLTPSALALAMIKEKKPLITAVSRVHGGDLYAERHSPSYLPFQRTIIEKLDRTYSISENGKDYLSKRYPDLEGRIGIERLGTINPSLPSEKKKSSILKIITCSYLKPVKRLHLLAKALKTTKIDIEWTHIGDGPEKKRIDEEIIKLPPNVNVVFLGSMHNKDILENYRLNNYTLFINVSESEGIPVTIMEAFSFGIPVIATDVGGTSELVNHENGDLIHKDFAPEDLMILIERYYHMNEIDYNQKSKNAYDTWNNNYNAEKNYKLFIDNLRRISENGK